MACHCNQSIQKLPLDSDIIDLLSNLIKEKNQELLRIVVEELKEKLTGSDKDIVKKLVDCRHQVENNDQIDNKETQIIAYQVENEEVPNQKNELVLRTSTILSRQDEEEEIEPHLVCTGCPSCSWERCFAPEENSLVEFQDKEEEIKSRRSSRSSMPDLIPLVEHENEDEIDLSDHILKRFIEKKPNHIISLIATKQASPAQIKQFVQESPDHLGLFKNPSEQLLIDSISQFPSQIADVENPSFALQKAAIKYDEDTKELRSNANFLLIETPHPVIEVIRIVVDRDMPYLRIMYTDTIKLCFVIGKLTNDSELIQQCSKFLSHQNGDGDGDINSCIEDLKHYDFDQESELCLVKLCPDLVKYLPNLKTPSLDYIIDHHQEKTLKLLTSSIRE